MITANELFKVIELAIRFGMELANGTRFVEVSTHVKHELPNLNPSVVEMFRDLIYPIQRKLDGPQYEVIGTMNGSDIFRGKFFYSIPEAENFISEKKSEGFVGVKWIIFHK